MSLERGVAPLEFLPGESVLSARRAERPAGLVARCGGYDGEVDLDKPTASP